MAPTDQRKRILYLCTGNSCRSQMAEGLTRSLRGHDFEAFSAGVKPKEVDPLAVKAMAEDGIDIAGQGSKDLDQLGQTGFDYVVTLCDNARDNCPYLPGSHKNVHCGFDDPPFLAKDAAGEDEAMGHYRRVRDEIRRMVLGLPESLGQC